VIGAKKKAAKPQRPPRRKAGSIAKPKSMRTTTFRITIEAQEMIVTYEPNWLDGSNGHFEFTSPHEPRRRIVVSESGYLSHFVPMDAIKTFKSPEDYARAFVTSILESRRKPTRGQLSLF
jgi:hypothetical protein